MSASSSWYYFSKEYCNLLPGVNYRKKYRLIQILRISAVLPPGGVPLIHYDGHVNPEMAQEAPR